MTSLYVDIVSPFGSVRMTDAGSAAVNVTKRDLKDAVKSMAPTVCRDVVRPGYVYGAVDTAQYIAVAYSVEVTMVRRRPYEVVKPVGFTLAYNVEDGLYIDVICSSAGSGAKLLNAMINFYSAVVPNGAITLSSMPTVLAFYPRFGFQFRKSCSEATLAIPQPIVEGLRQYAAARKFPLTRQEAYDDPVYGALMEFLQENDYNVKKTNCSKYMANKYKDYDCGEDGYTMKRCPSMAGGRSKRPSARRSKPRRSPRRSARRSARRST